MNPTLRSLLVSLALVAVPAFAADDEDRLKAGSAVPAFAPKKMIRDSAPDLKSERGCAVVVFWKSTEGPSRQSVAALNRVWREHAPRGLQMVLVSEEDEDALKKLEKGREGAPLGSIASDKDGTTKTDWLAAAKIDSLPRAFIVGRGGRVLWIGSPLDENFEATVRRAMGGRFDPASRAKIEPSLRAAQKCAELRNFAEAYKHYGEAIDGDPGIATDAVEERYKTTLLKDGNAAAANAWIIDIAKKRYAGDPGAMTEFIEMIVRDPEIKDRSLDTAEQLVEAMGAKTGVDSLAMQALLASARGDAQKALDLQTDAWMTASAFRKPDLKRALDEYRAAARRQSAAKTDAGKPGGG